MSLKLQNETKVKRAHSLKRISSFLTKKKGAKQTPDVEKALSTPIVIKDDGKSASDSRRIKQIRRQSMQITKSLEIFAPLSGESYLDNKSFSVAPKSALSPTSLQKKVDEFAVFMDGANQDIPAPPQRIEDGSRTLRRKSKRVSVASLSFSKIMQQNDENHSSPLKDPVKKRFSFRKTPSQMKLLLSSPSTTKKASDNTVNSNGKRRSPQGEKAISRNTLGDVTNQNPATSETPKRRKSTSPNKEDAIAKTTSVTEEESVVSEENDESIKELLKELSEKVGMTFNTIEEAELFLAELEASSDEEDDEQ